MLVLCTQGKTEADPEYTAKGQVWTQAKEQFPQASLSLDLVSSTGGGCTP